MIGNELSRETNLLIMNAALSNGVEPLLMLAHLLGEYDGLIDEIYGPYAVTLSTSDGVLSMRRKFVIAINLIRFIESQTGSRVRAYTSFRTDESFRRMFDRIISMGDRDGH